MLVLASVLFIVAFVIDLYMDIFWLSEVFILLSVYLLSLNAYTNTLYNKVKTRFLLLITSCLSALYIVIMVLMYSTGQDYLDYVYLALSGLFTIVFVRGSLLTFDAKDKFNQFGTFLAYKKPKRLQGYLASLLWGYGSVAVVINGIEFKFKQGKFIEREHITGRRYIYKKINNVPIERARLMLGEKWKWYRNCFTLIIGDIINARATRHGTQDHKRRGY